MVEAWSVVFGVRGRKLREAPLIRRTWPCLDFMERPSFFPLSFAVWMHIHTKPRSVFSFQLLGLRAYPLGCRHKPTLPQKSLQTKQNVLVRKTMLSSNRPSCILPLVRFRSGHASIFFFCSTHPNPEPRLTVRGNHGETKEGCG